MNKEKQRIAIAEACGYKPHTPGALGVLRWIAEYHETNDISSGVLYLDELPDYLNDLNAMHEAENILDANQRVEYASLITRQFIDEIYQVIPNNLDFPICFPAINVKAEVKAENFLRAIGKWEDEA